MIVKTIPQLKVHSWALVIFFVFIDVYHILLNLLKDHPKNS